MSLREEVRSCVILLDKGGEEVVSIVIQRLKNAGAINNIHVGNSDLDSDQTVEWYAGQILEVLEKEQWFAVNSIINCLDKFCPEIKT
jgi:hypothetical protein